MRAGVTARIRYRLRPRKRKIPVSAREPLAIGLRADHGLNGLARPQILGSGITH
jgi:hypothetical protein